MIGLGALVIVGGAVWYFFRTSKALAVLMFHKIAPERQDALTVSIEQLEQQLASFVAWSVLLWCCNLGCLLSAQ